MSSSPTFPQELFDAIIDYLHDDLKALLACSLVCRNWVERCRVHKFASSTITTGSGENHKSFNDFPVALKYLQNLTIINHLRVWCTGSSSPKLPDTSLKTLSVDGMIFVDSMTYPFHIYAGLRVLNLTRCIVPDPSKFIHFLLYFPNLDSLSIKYMFHQDFTVAPTFAEGQHADPPPLTGDLQISEAGSIYGESQAQSTLVSLASLPMRFRSIEVKSSREHCVAELNTLFRICGSRVQTVDLSYLFFRDQSLDFRHNIDLRVLFVAPAYISPHHLILMLSSINSSSLHTLGLSSSCFEHSDFPWETVDVLLTSSRFPALRVLKVTRNVPRDTSSRLNSPALPLPRVNSSTTITIERKYEE